MTSVETTQRFVESKGITTNIITKINDIMTRFYNEIKKIKENQILLNIINNVPMEDIKDASENLKVNLGIISRDKMKCVFFGKTSNGKSAVINGILNENLLPSSIGRTTSCFITVEGCDDEVGYLIDKNGNKCDPGDIRNIANEFNQERYEIGSAVAIFWPKKQCSLLQNDVQFLDSPGVDYSNEHKKWIQQYCKDADVFVYVVDSCSTINESEKLFFREVKSLVANPNIFILMNKWDLCEKDLSDTRLAKVKRQHLATVKNFFEGDLKIMNCDSEVRTFFLSAKEMFEECTTPQSTRRKEEFKRFVTMMQGEMSHKAIINKFQPHLIKGKESLQKVFDSIGTILETKRKDVSEKCDQSHLEAEIDKFQQTLFEETNQTFTHTVEKESHKFVSFIVDSTKDLSQLEGKVNDLVRRLMDNLNRLLTNTTQDVLNSIKSFLLSFSQLNDSINYLDDYFPCIEDPEVITEENVTHAKKGPRNEGSSEDNTAGGIKPDSCSSTDLISSIAIIIPLNMELGIILSKEKILKLEEKKHKNEVKQSTKEKLYRKISGILSNLFLKLLKQRQSDIKRVTDILIQNFLTNHAEYCQFIASMEPIRNECITLAKDIEVEMTKIIEFENSKS